MYPVDLRRMDLRMLGCERQWFVKGIIVEHNNSTQIQSGLGVFQEVGSAKFPPFFHPEFTDLDAGGEANGSAWGVLRSKTERPRQQRALRCITILSCRVPFFPMCHLQMGRHSESLTLQQKALLSRMHLKHSGTINIKFCEWNVASIGFWLTIKCFTNNNWSDILCIESLSPGSSFDHEGGEGDGG